MKIRAAVLREIGLPQPYAESKPLQIEELELDGPGDGEVLVHIKAAGLCHSDLSVINGTRKWPVPIALGHEAAGEVVQVGKGIKDLQAGDHVVCTFVPSCGHCLPCKEGRPALCEAGADSNKKGTLLCGERRLHGHGESIHHHLGVSGFADYAVVSRESLVSVGQEIPFEQAALFGCAVITGVGAVVNTARIHAGSRIAVIGLGGVGLSAIMGAKLAGAREIIAVDVDPRKLPIAKSLGATNAFDARNKDVAEEIKKVTDGGVDYAFETAGSIQAMQTAYQITRRGGTTVTTGLPDPKQHLSIPQATLTAEERTVKGSYLGSCVPSRDIPNLIELFKQGRLPVERMLTETIELEEINEGFERLANGDVCRLVVVI